MQPALQTHAAKSYQDKLLKNWILSDLARNLRRPSCHLPDG